MATITAAAGGGNWTAGATWVGGVAPTAADNVLLTVTSGNVVIDTGAVARSVDCTGYTGTLTHNASVILTLGDATAGAGNVALKLVAGMTYTPPTSSNIIFQSSSATQQTITTAGKTLANWQLNNATGSYILGDALTSSVAQTFTMNAGTLNTGNFPMSVGLISIAGSSAKTLTLGSSAITITGNASTAVNYSGSNCTFTANTAVMTFTGASAGITSSSVANWNGMSAVFTTAVSFGKIVGGTTLNNVTYTGPANKTASFNFQTTTITGTLTITGNSTVNRLLVSSSNVGTVYTVTAAAVSLSNVDFMDITAAGAAIPWTGTSMGDALGNTSITFDAPTTQTNTGATGNWSDATKWTSRVPLPQDTVVVNTGSGTITADMPRLGADVSFAGFAGTLASSVAQAVYGSVTLGATMAGYTGAFTLTLSARSAKTITSNGKTFSHDIVISAPGGGIYTLQDGLIVGAGGVRFITFSAGTFDTNAKAVNANWTVSAGAGHTLTVTNSTLTCPGTSGVPWNISAAATTVNAAGSTIIYSAVGPTALTFAGGGKTYGTLTYIGPGATGSLTITGSNTFNTLNFSDASNARSLLFTAGTTTTVTNFNVFGTAGKLMTLDTATGTGTFTLVKVAP